MSLPVSLARFHGKDRRDIIQAVQKQMQAGAFHAIRQGLMACLQAEVTAQPGREKGEARRASSHARESDWKCGSCGCQDANFFTGDGQYHRNLETGYGHLHALPIPMVECQHCHHEVMCQFALLGKYERFWLDLQQDALFRSGLGQSLRAIKERWSGHRGSPVGLRTMNELINQGEPLVHQMQEQHFPDAPTLVQCEGIWVTIQSQKEAIAPDKTQRKRHQRTGEKVVLLVAPGFWPDGRRELLDWERANSEAQTHGELLVKRLWMREVTAERGVKMIVRDGCGGLGEAVALVDGSNILEQRCLFHRLKNVGEKVRRELKGKEHQATRKAVMEQAALIYRAPDAEAARQLMGEGSHKWRPQAPEAVAALERDVEHTLVFSQLETVACGWSRTTS